jgi:hypothetical protein
MLHQQLIQLHAVLCHIGQRHGVGLLLPEEQQILVLLQLLSNTTGGSIGCHCTQIKPL